MNSTWETVAIIVRLLFMVSFLLVIIGSFGYIGSMFMPELTPRKQQFLQFAKIGGGLVVGTFIVAWVLGNFFSPSPLIDPNIWVQQ